MLWWLPSAHEKTSAEAEKGHHNTNNNDDDDDKNNNHDHENHQGNNKEAGSSRVVRCAAIRGVEVNSQHLRAIDAASDPKCLCRSLRPDCSR